MCQGEAMISGRLVSLFLFKNKMAKKTDDITLIQLHEKLWNCKNRNGFVQIDVNGKKIIALVEDILPVTGEKYNKTIRLAKRDIYGNEVNVTAFKLSELQEEII